MHAQFDRHFNIIFISAPNRMTVWQLKLVSAVPATFHAQNKIDANKYPPKYIYYHVIISFCLSDIVLSAALYGIQICSLLTEEPIIYLHSIFVPETTDFVFIKYLSLRDTDLILNKLKWNILAKAEIRLYGIYYTIVRIQFGEQQCTQNIKCEQKKYSPLVCSKREYIVNTYAHIHLTSAIISLFWK